MQVTDCRAAEKKIPEYIAIILPQIEAAFGFCYYFSPIPKSRLSVYEEYLHVDENNGWIGEEQR